MRWTRFTRVLGQWCAVRNAPAACSLRPNHSALLRTMKDLHRSTDAKNTTWAMCLAMTRTNDGSLKKLSRSSRRNTSALASAMGSTMSLLTSSSFRTSTMACHWFLAAKAYMKTLRATFGTFRKCTWSWLSWVASWWVSSCSCSSANVSFSAAGNAARVGTKAQQSIKVTRNNRLSDVLKMEWSWEELTKKKMKMWARSKLPM